MRRGGSGRIGDKVRRMVVQREEMNDKILRLTKMVDVNKFALRRDWFSST